MNEKALKTLEYYKITELLEGFATSPMGKDMCRHLTPSEDLGQIQILQQETADALARIYQKGSFLLAELRISGDLKKTGNRRYSGNRRTSDIAGLLENAGRAKSYSRRDTDEGNTDSLDPMFEILEPLTPLSTEIRRCILSPDEIADDASPGLRQVRRNMKNINEKIHSQLSSYISGSSRTLSSGRSDHHAERPVLYSCKIRV